MLYVASAIRKNAMKSYLREISEEIEIGKTIGK